METEYLEVKDPYGFIYITTNIMNGMRYLGQKKFDRIWKTYLGSGSIIRKAIKKYGKENFCRDIICFCYSPEELNKVEYDLSVFFNVVDDDNWYNLCYGGGSTSGYRRSDEEKAMLSRIITEKMANPEVKAKMQKHIESRDYTGSNNPNYNNHKLAGENNPMWNKTHTEETRKKISVALSNPSEERRAEMSARAKAQMTPEFIEYLRQINTGRHPTEETREKMSVSQRARWTDELKEEWSAKFSGKGNGMYGRHHSEETKALLSAMFSGENSYMYGKHPSEETIQKIIDNSPLKIEVVKTTLDGVYVEEYGGLGIAARENGISEPQVHRSCTTHKSAGGYLYTYKWEYEQNPNIVYTNNNVRAVVQLDEGFNFIAQFESTRGACRETGILHQNIGKCCKDKTHKRTAGGFHWMYLEDYEEFIKNKNI